MTKSSWSFFQKYAHHLFSRIYETTIFFIKKIFVHTVFMSDRSFQLRSRYTKNDNIVTVYFNKKSNFLLHVNTWPESSILNKTSLYTFQNPYSFGDNFHFSLCRLIVNESFDTLSQWSLSLSTSTFQFPASFG